MGKLGRQRRISLTIAHTYGRQGASAKVGRRPRPTTASSSSCARRCTSGKAIIACAHHASVVAVVSPPAELRCVVSLHVKIRLIITYTLTTKFQRGTTFQSR